jgi:hypothetical protein
MLEAESGDLNGWKDFRWTVKTFNIGFKIQFRSAKVVFDAT